VLVQGGWHRQAVSIETAAEPVVKSDVGRRTVAIPVELARILDEHLSTYVDPGPNAVVFTGDKGAPITTQHWSKKFREAADGAGAPELHFHDLRLWPGPSRRRLARRPGS
jgi:integrase